MAPKFNFFKMATASGASGGAAAGTAAKRRLSDMEVNPALAKVARTSGAAGSRPTTAPVTISIRKYGDSAADFVGDWPEGQSVWQVQITHDASPSMAVNIVDGMQRYLADLHEGDASMPATLSELKRSAGVSLVITRLDPNPYAAPLVNWRIAFYAIGPLSSLSECLKLILGYIEFRALRPLAIDRVPFDPPENPSDRATAPPAAEA